jgi:DNA-binding response OmpR family regulator
MRILFVEDDLKIADFVQKGLLENGLSIEICHDGITGLQRAEQGGWDVILLDIMLPEMDGLTILEKLRAADDLVPVILLTAKGEVNERIEGLNRGADDYLPKPFFVDELIARIHAVARRTNEDAHYQLKHGDLEVDRLNRTVHVGTELVEFTRREYDLLEMLMRSPGKVYSRKQILERVWGYNFDPQTNVVDVYIRRVRQKIDREGESTMIETLRGVGYRFQEAAG